MATLLNEGFESATVLSGYNREAISGGVSRSLTQAKTGLAACKFYINKADTGYGGGPHRSEIHSPVEEYLFNQDYWIGCNVYLENWATDPEPEQIIQFHNVPNFGAGETWGTLKLLTPFGIQIKNNNYEIVHGFVQDSDAANPNGTLNNNRVSAGAITNNGWTKWVIHCRWHYATGILEVWKDDVLVYSKTGNTYYNDEKGPYHKIGIYKWPWTHVGNVSTTTQRTMYLDNWKIAQGSGTTYNDVDPQPNNMTSDSPNIQVTVTKEGTYSYRLIVTANGLSTEVAGTEVFKPDPTPVDSFDPYPPDASYLNIAAPVLKKPGYGVAGRVLENSLFEDGAIRAISRVTDDVVFNTVNPRSHYSKTQVWNCDMTKMLLWWHLVDAKTYQSEKRINALVGAQANTKWSNVNPDKIYYLYSGKFWALTPSTEQKMLLFDFGAIGYTSVTIGGNEGTISRTDKYTVFQGIKNGQQEVIIFNLQTNTIKGSRTAAALGAINGIDHSDILPYETKIYIARKGVGQSVYDLDFNFIRNCFGAGLGSHCALGLDAPAGNEVMISAANPFAIVRVSDGVQYATGVSNVTAYNGSNSGGQISCLNIQYDGWALVTWSNGKREMWLMKLDGSGTVKRFGSLRNNGTAINPDDSIRGSVSPDGTKVIGNTAWAGDTKVLAYVIERIE